MGSNRSHGNSFIDAGTTSNMDKGTSITSERIYCLKAAS